MTVYTKEALYLSGDADNGTKWWYLRHGLEVDLYIEFVAKKMKIVE